MLNVCGRAVCHAVHQLLEQDIKCAQPTTNQHKIEEDLCVWVCVWGCVGRRG